MNVGYKYCTNNQRQELISKEPILIEDDGFQHHLKSFKHLAGLFPNETLRTHTALLFEDI